MEEKKGKLKTALDWLRNWWNPVGFARQLVFICLIILDATNLFRFAYTFMSPSTRAEQMMLPFGLVIPMTVAVFDATALAGTITPTIYFISKIVAKRRANGDPNKTYWAALLAGSLLSGLANGGAFFLDANNITLLTFIGDHIFIPIILGVVVMLGLLFYTSMDAWDETRKKLAQDKLDEQDRVKAELDAIKRDPRRKHTPNKHIPAFRVPTQATQTPVKLRRKVAP